MRCISEVGSLLVDCRFHPTLVVGWNVGLTRKSSTSGIYIRGVGLGGDRVCLHLMLLAIHPKGSVMKSITLSVDKSVVRRCSDAARVHWVEDLCKLALGCPKIRILFRALRNSGYSCPLGQDAYWFLFRFFEAAVKFMSPPWKFIAPDSYIEKWSFFTMCSKAYRTTLKKTFMD